MMLRILAVTPEDGWAYVRSGDEIHLLRPPYTKSTTARVNEDAVAKAITAYGFSASEQECQDWKEVVFFLNQLVADSRDDLDASGHGEAFLELATREDLVIFLDRVETELLPGHKWEHAENVLIALLKLQQIQQDSDLLTRTTTLMQNTYEGRTRAQRDRQQLATGGTDTNALFPRVAKQYGQTVVTNYADNVRQQHQIFQLAS